MFPLFVARGHGATDHETTTKERLVRLYSYWNTFSLMVVSVGLPWWPSSDLCPMCMTSE